MQYLKLDPGSRATPPEALSLFAPPEANRLPLETFDAHLQRSQPLGATIASAGNRVPRLELLPPPPPPPPRLADANRDPRREAPPSDSPQSQSSAIPTSSPPREASLSLVNESGATAARHDSSTNSPGTPSKSSPASPSATPGDASSSLHGEQDASASGNPEVLPEEKPDSEAATSAGTARRTHRNRRPAHPRLASVANSDQDDAGQGAADRPESLAASSARLQIEQLPNPDSADGQAAAGPTDIEPVSEPRIVLDGDAALVAGEAAVSGASGPGNARGTPGHHRDAPQQPGANLPDPSAELAPAAADRLAAEPRAAGRNNRSRTTADAIEQAAPAEPHRLEPGKETPTQSSSTPEFAATLESALAPAATSKGHATADSSPAAVGTVSPSLRFAHHLAARPGERPAKSAPLSELERTRLVDRVARAFQAAEQRGGAVTLRLHPPELGALRVELSVSDGVLSARLEAETQTARAALLENVHLLHDRLAEHGVRVERFDVDLLDRRPPGDASAFTQPQDRDSESRRQPNTASQGSESAEQESIRPPPQLRGPGQLNVVV